MEKRNNGLVVFLVLVIVALVGVVLYMSGIFDKKDDTDKKQENESVQNENQSNDSGAEVGEDLDVNSDLVTGLYANISEVNNAWNNGTIWGYFYQKDNVTVGTMDNKVKLYLALKKADKEQEVSGTFYIPVSASSVASAMKEIFGNISYIDESLSATGGCGESYATYDASIQKYKIGTGCGGVTTGGYATKIIKAQKYENRIEIFEQHIYGAVEYLKNSEGVYDRHVTRIYKNASRTNGSYEGIDFIKEVEGDSTSDDISQGDTYKYTFKYNKDDNKYYFHSAEKVK